VRRLGQQPWMFVTPEDVDAAAADAVTNSNALRLWYAPRDERDTGLDKDLRRVVESAVKYCAARGLRTLTMAELRPTVPKDLEVQAQNLVTEALNWKFLVIRSGGDHVFKCRLLHAWIMSEVLDVGANVSPSLSGEGLHQSRGS
jgi:hypothetical protein